MAKKYKMTGCARFLIFFLILAPTIYFGVSYFRGENPIEPIKNAIPDTWGKESSGNGGTISEDAILTGQIKTLKDRIKELEKENGDLQQIIDARESEINRLRNN